MDDLIQSVNFVAGIVFSAGVVMLAVDLLIITIIVWKRRRRHHA